MKITHKINHGWAPDRTDPVWAEKVEREANATTDATEHRWNKAKERLARAEQKLTEATARHERTADIKRLTAAVELRREELAELDRLMRETPQGSVHRGRGSYRGIT